MSCQGCERRRRAADLAASRVRQSLRRLYAAVLAEKANFNRDQPRVPRGHHDGGQWTDGGLPPTVGLAAATREQKERCYDDCYVLLERFKMQPGEDYNETDFRRCIRDCLGQYA
jgi:hypothetical protein